MQARGHAKNTFLRGMKDGIPIGLGYLAVSFSLGIAVRNAGMTAFQGFLMSWLGMASAGEYAAVTVIAAGHFETEALSMEALRQKVQGAFPTLKTVRLDETNPITFVAPKG